MEYTIHVGLTHKVPLDQYENVDIALNMTVKVEADTPPKLAVKDMKAMDKVQAEMTGVLIARMKGEEGRVIAEWLERGKLKDLRLEHEAKAAAAAAKKAAKKKPKKEKDGGMSLIGRKEGE